MTSMRKGLIVALVQILMIIGIGAKFLIDRQSYPKVWIATRPFDPNLPIRGRYVQLAALVTLQDQPMPKNVYETKHVRLMVVGDALVALSDEHGHQIIKATSCGLKRLQLCWVLAEPMAYFIPEHSADPSLRRKRTATASFP